MKKRILSLVLTVALLFGVMCTLGVTAAETTTPELNIAATNLSFKDTVYIKYAVPVSEYDVKLLIWTAPADEYTLATADDEITKYNTVDLEGHFTFNYTKLAAKQMTDVVYARAYANIDGVDTYGDVVKYSILQYAYNMLNKDGTAESLKDLLNDMLAYGAAAQIYFDHNADRLATDAWFKVTVADGCTVDGFKCGLYLAGDTVTLAAPEFDENGFPFSGWKNGAGIVVGETATCEITVTGVDTYTPSYADPSAMPEMPEWPAASEGLELSYDEEEGIAFVDGIGDCTDTVIVIPAEYEGFPVVEISAKAFEGEAITAVYFPNTLESIVGKAFQNCSALTDVYYNGTPTEWEENVIVNRYNDPITNATMHFNPFLVTFVDYNGRVLKYELVYLGESATAPADPTRANYVFAGWNVDFSAVEENLTVVAQYKYDSEGICLVVGDAVAVDGIATLTISIQNNPGLAAINSTLSEEDKAMLVSAENGGIFPTLDVGENLFWNADGNCEGDGVLATLTFDVEGLEAGTYPIILKLQEAVQSIGGIPGTFDISQITVIAGSITVK